MSLKHITAAALATALIVAPDLALGQSAPQMTEARVPREPGARFDPAQSAVKRPDPQRYEHQVATLLEVDKTPPAPCPILFFGSASVAQWKTIKEDTAPDPVVGRGLGMSTFQDWGVYFDKLVLSYKPRAIFMYLGENDIVNGLTPEEALVDFKKILAMKTKALGATPFYFVSIRNTPARLKWAVQQQKFNDLVLALSKQRSDLHYIDITHDNWVDGKLFGKLKEDASDASGMHVSPQARADWNRVIKPFIDKEAARENVCR